MDIILSLIRRYDVKAAAVEDQIQLLLQTGVQDVILFPHDVDALFLRFRFGETYSRSGNVGRGHIESSAG